MNKDNTAYEKIFCARLKELRSGKNLTQKAVANSLGIAESTYANWEQGRTQPCVADIFKLLQVFAADANELFYFER